ncbi:flagellar hook assembly protein [Agaricicola taiwanensis]|uniref:Basal-body rod modification protein FlgD n=1 Tax=Agaricicola taiwanensis TaxID=591372 RepID=A0A8J2VW14_9RHOB|nr:flagellar hook capping FlgD N-terminal domain-containing protein [Agaricicola taiwanensis]GGE39728.1 flagellar hook assembly protein [Agaricicola taiwanensis]
MADVSGAVPGTRSSSTSTTSNASATIAKNFDQFLLLLTTQLQNQNPLDPLDTNQFTQQLVQFASVEQQIQTNTTLSALLAMSESNKVSDAVGFLGAKVVAEGSSTLFDGKTAEWNISTASNASRVQVEVLDVNGNVVYTDEISMSGTSAKYTWNGDLSTNGKAGQGIYRLSVRAFDENSKAISASTDIMGTVDGIDLTGSEPVLKIGDLLVPMSLVKTVTKQTATAPAA